MTALVVLTDRQIQRIAEQVEEEGLSCKCGREASDAQKAMWVRDLQATRRPVEWACPQLHYCGECRGRGHLPASDPGTPCPICDGNGEVRCDGCAALAFALDKRQRKFQSLKDDYDDLLARYDHLESAWHDLDADVRFGRTAPAREYDGDHLTTVRHGYSDSDRKVGA